MRGGPAHKHEEYWTRDEHYRFDERVARELDKLEDAVDKLTTRVTLLVGGLGVLAFLANVFAPVIRAFFQVDN